MLGVLLRLPGTWDDPAQAWPPSSQPLLPGPVGMYAAAVLTFWLPALLYGLLVRLLSPRARRRRKQRGARWASWWQLRRLLVLGPRRGRIILGRRDRLRDRLLGRLYLAVEQCHSVLAFGPPGIVQDPRPRHPGHPGMARQPGHDLHQTGRPPRYLCPPGQPGGRLGLRPPRPVRGAGSPVDTTRLLPQLHRRQAHWPDAGRRRRYPRAQGR
jgi:hypothetical protein